MHDGTEAGKPGGRRRRGLRSRRARPEKPRKTLVSWASLVPAPPREPRFHRPERTITLTPQQAAAMEALAGFLERPGHGRFLLAGFAGTGKSTLCALIVRRFARLRFALTATTNKAVRVLRAMADEQRLDATCQTVHSLLFLVPTEEEGVLRLQQKQQPDLSAVDVLVVDECSMVSEELMGFLDELPGRHAVKLLFLGDPAQLPPVKEGVSPSLRLPEGALLTDIVRQQAGNPILELASRLRACIDDPQAAVPAVEPAAQGDCGVFVARDESVWFTWIRHYFRQEETRADPDRFRVLTWSNRRVRQVNDLLQEALHGPSPAPFRAGQRVLVTAPVFEGAGKRQRRVLIGVDEECRVLDLRPAAVEGVPAWRVSLAGETDPQPETACVPALIPDDAHLAAYEARLAELRGRALADRRRWRDYYAFRDSFCRLQLPWAMTVHRSQGSTFRHVFIDMPHILQNPDRTEAMKMLYVALTRAQRSVLVLVT